MTQNLQDIDVSDNYGRAKRASLLYSAGLVVLAFAIPTSAALNVSILGAMIPLAAAKVLTWLAAAYYTLNFYFEWRVARIINSKAMANEFGGSVNDRFKELAERFQRYSDRVTETSEAYVSALNGVTSNIERFVADVLKQDKDSQDQLVPTLSAKGTEEFKAKVFESNEIMRRDFILKLDRASSERLNAFKMTIQNDVAIVEGRAIENMTAYGAIKDHLGVLASDFNTLAGRFNTEQKFMFYGLDLGVVVAIFVFGTAISFGGALRVVLIGAI